MTFKPNPYAIAAIVLAGIAYAPLWGQAGSFNRCLGIWESGLPKNTSQAERDLLFMRGRSWCAGGDTPGDLEVEAWLRNRMGVPQSGQ